MDFSPVWADAQTCVAGMSLDSINSLFFFWFASLYAFWLSNESNDTLGGEAGNWSARPEWMVRPTHTSWRGGRPPTTNHQPPSTSYISHLWRTRHHASPIGQQIPLTANLCQEWCTGRCKTFVPTVHLGATPWLSVALIDERERIIDSRWFLILLIAVIHRGTLVQRIFAGLWCIPVRKKRKNEKGIKESN